MRIVENILQDIQTKKEELTLLFAELGESYFLSIKNTTNTTNDDGNCNCHTSDFAKEEVKDNYCFFNETAEFMDEENLKKIFKNRSNQIVYRKKDGSRRVFDNVEIPEELNQDSKSKMLFILEEVDGQKVFKKIFKHAIQSIVINYL